MKPALAIHPWKASSTAAAYRQHLGCMLHYQVDLLPLAFEVAALTAAQLMTCVGALHSSFHWMMLQYGQRVH